MGFPKVVFRIIEGRSCPLNQYNDSFQLTGIAIPINNDAENTFITTAIINFPTNKKACKILYGDLSRIIIQYERGDKIPICMIGCSGCTGSIKLEHTRDDDMAAAYGPYGYSNELASMMHVLSGFAFFRHIDDKHLDNVIRFFKLSRYDKGNSSIRKDDPGENFYIIVSGAVNVLNDATIQVAEPTSILYIDRHDFRKILEHYQGIQLHFSRLMAEHLNKSNKIRAEDLSSGMTGNLSEIPAEALFQTLNMNRKTGILTINQLTKGTARFSFRQGSLIKAKYAEYVGDVAFYQILKEQPGWFRFTPGIPAEDFETPEIGFFMKLLMEGMRRLDEGRGRKTN